MENLSGSPLEIDWNQTACVLKGKNRGAYHSGQGPAGPEKTGRDDYGKPKRKERVDVDKEKQMKRLLIAVMVLCLGLAGCYRFVAEHPEKAEKEFYEDQALCEKKAREYAQTRLEVYSHSDEINHARRCMRGLGWEYHFRRSSSPVQGTEE